MCHMKKFSLKTRLMLMFTVVFVLIGAAAGALSWKETKESVDEFFDSYQMALARSLASADWSHVNSEIRAQTHRALKDIRDADDDDDAIGFAVFDNQGRRIFDDNEEGKEFSFNTQTGAFFNEMNDDDLWRVIRVKSADGNFIIAVGQELEYRSDIAWDMIEEFMTPWLWGLAALLILMLLVIVREFRPLRRLVGDIKQRRPEDLSPLAADGLPTEITPLVGAVNGLLFKIENTFQRERRFVADAAHELRTPLTALNVQLEVLEMSADDQKSREKAVQNLSQGLKRAAHLVEQLLALSRLDASLAADEQKKEVLEWGKICRSIFDEYAEAAAEKNIKFVCEVGKEGPIDEGNPALAATIVRNLVENAVKYSPEGAAVSLKTTNGRLSVINSGVKVDEEHLSKLGQRFYRPSGQNEKGSGLGLSIVKLIAEYYGCALSFKNTEQGFCVEVERI